MPDHHVILVGPMGSGKTTIGTLLASSLGLPFVDSDRQLVTATGRNASRIAESDGVAALHQAEAEALLAALAAPEPAVIAAAASVADQPEILDAVRRAAAQVVLVEAPLEILAQRVPAEDHRRPIGLEELAAFSAERRRSLLGLGPIAVIDTSTAPPADSVATIIRRLDAVEES